MGIYIYIQLLLNIQSNATNFLLRKPVIVHTIQFLLRCDASVWLASTHTTVGFAHLEDCTRMSLHTLPRAIG